MPAAANKQPGDVLLASEWNTLATTANNGESGAESAATTANSALTKANAAYVKSAQGIPGTDLLPAFTAGLTYTFLWNGSNYVLLGAGGDVVLTAAAGNSSAAGRATAGYPGSLRLYKGPADPDALGLMIDGDDWKDTA